MQAPKFWYPFGRSCFRCHLLRCHLYVFTHTSLRDQSLPHSSSAHEVSPFAATSGDFLTRDEVLEELDRVYQEKVNSLHSLAAAIQQILKEWRDWCGVGRAAHAYQFMILRPSLRQVGFDRLRATVLRRGAGPTKGRPAESFRPANIGQASRRRSAGDTAGHRSDQSGLKPCRSHPLCLTFQHNELEGEALSQDPRHLRFHLAFLAHVVQIS